MFKITYEDKPKKIDSGVVSSVYAFKLTDNKIQMIGEGEKLLNEFSLWQIDSQKSGPYLLKYEGKIVKTQLPLGSLEVTQEGSTLKVRGVGENYELTLLIDESRPNLIKSLITFSKIDLFDAGIDLILQIDNPFIQNGGKFTTDANGYFEMERETKEKWEISVFPVNSHFVITDPNTQ